MVGAAMVGAAVPAVVNAATPRPLRITYLSNSEPGVQGMLDFLSETIPEAKKVKPAQFFDDRLVKQLDAGK